MTETIGQAQVVERSIVGHISQADGYHEPTAIQKRIGEIVLRDLGFLANARWYEGVLRLTNADLDALSDAQLTAELHLADKVINAISEEECEEIALKYGL